MFKTVLKYAITIALVFFTAAAFISAYKKQRAKQNQGAAFFLTAAICVSYVLHLCLLVLFRQMEQWDIFFAGGGDFLADYFNSVRFVSNKDVYMNPIGRGYSCYLPLCYVLLLPFARIVDFSTLSLGACWSNPRAVICALSFTVISFALFFHSLKCLVKKYGASQTILVPLLLSNLTLFTLERGNWIMATAAFLYYFLAFYESESKAARYFAAASLVVASVFKVYPVLFGLLYLRKKDFKMIAFCILLGIPMTLLPFLAFKSGFKAIPTFLETLHLNSTWYQTDLNPKFAAPYLFIMLGDAIKQSFSVPAETPMTLFKISSIVTRVICIYAILLSFKTKDIFAKLFLITMSVLYLPAHSEYYCGLYIFPLVAMFAATFKERSKSDKIVYMLYFTLLLQDIQFVQNGRNFTRIGVDIITLLVFVYAVVKATAALFSKQERQ